jgi:hypothetical protein
MFLIIQNHLLIPMFSANFTHHVKNWFWQLLIWATEYPLLSTPIYLRKTNQI